MVKNSLSYLVQSFLLLLLFIWLLLNMIKVDKFIHETRVGIRRPLGIHLFLYVDGAYFHNFVTTENGKYCLLGNVERKQYEAELPCLKVQNKICNINLGKKNTPLGDMDIE